ncbi:MAG: hypothetical protein AAFY98_07515 [Verrucomicrobiota bacterium]
MKEPNWPSCSEKQLWEYVASYLASNGIQTVMVGGSVVAIYSNGLYQSGDIDLIQSDVTRATLTDVLKEISFYPEGRLFRHPLCPHLYLDFPPGPVAIGDDYHIQPEEQEINGQVIQLLSPTDCIKDRLASYIHFGNRDTLDQAVLVGQKQRVNKKEIKIWCDNESRPDAYSDWLRLL